VVARVLTRHFIDQAIHNETFGRAADARRWALAAVGVLGVIGGVAAFLLLPDARVTSRLANADAVRAFSRPDRLMAIVASMVSAGLLSCAIWPWMVFDRRDVEILTGLPLPARAIVRAKLSALGAIVLVFACATQLPAALAFGSRFSAEPSIVASAYTAGVHLLVQVAAGVFVFLFVVAVQAVALVLVGPRSFVKFSAVVQTILTAVIVAAVTYAPDLYFRARDDLRAFAGPMPFWLAHGPLGWFLGAYDALLGSRAGIDVQQAWNAVAAIGACLVVTLAAYPVMYRRLTAAAIGQSKRSARRRTTSLVERVSRRLGRDRTTQAASAFVLLSLLRSPRHRQTLAIALGFAVAYCAPSMLRWWPHLATPSTRPAAELLAVPIEAIFFLVGGLLVATSLPADSDSRWVWRVTEPDRRGLRSAVRRVTFLVGVLPVVAIMTPVYWFGWGPPLALGHAAACAAIGALLIVVSTIRRRTEPCAWPLAGPGPAPIVIGVWFLAAYVVFTDWFPMLERRMVGSPATVWSAIAGLALVTVLTRQIGVGKTGARRRTVSVPTS
jgi:hypothetical protein